MTKQSEVTPHTSARTDLQLLYPHPHYGPLRTSPPLPVSVCKPLQNPEKNWGTASLLPSVLAANDTTAGAVFGALPGGVSPLQGMQCMQELLCPNIHPVLTWKDPWSGSSTHQQSRFLYCSCRCCLLLFCCQCCSYTLLVLLSLLLHLPLVPFLVFGAT